MTKTKVDWIIHAVMNDVECSACGTSEKPFLDGIADIQTRGMDKYGHPEFQIVLDCIDIRISQQILNSLGLRVAEGERFESGMQADDVIQNFPVRFQEFMNHKKPVLRVIFPDPNGKFPEEEGCIRDFALQAFPMEFLTTANDIM